MNNRTRSPRIAALVLAALLLLAAPSLLAQSSRPREAFEAAMSEIAGAAAGSAAEAQAMEKAIVAARALPSPPTAPETVIEHLGRAKAAARAAGSASDFLDSAMAFGNAARLAPWVAEHHYNRGLMLEKAERFEEAALALQLYLKAAPNARDGNEVRERIAGLRYLKEKAERSKSGAATSISGLYYNDGDFNEASSTTMMGHATITALRIADGRITCGTFNPPNRNLSRSEGFFPNRDGELGMANTTVALAGAPVTFCDNVRWCPTGGETGYRTGLVASLATDGKSISVRANNCLARRDAQILNWHPLR